MQRPLENRRALVCGGSQGIGRACALELAKLGAQVTLVSRNEQTLQATLADLDTGCGQTHACVSVDFNDPAAVGTKVQEHVASTGPHVILVNNTGGPPSGPILEAQGDAFLRAISNHVVCNQILVQTLLPGMREIGYGRVINIISTSVILPIGGLGVSNTTRGAVANWGRTMAAELAPHGITVNNVLPGYTDTERLQSLFDKKAARTGTDAGKIKADTIGAIPMQRLAEPAEIGAVVAFLATPAASYLTGANLPVDGGRTAIQ